MISKALPFPPSGHYKVPPVLLTGFGAVLVCPWTDSRACQTSSKTLSVLPTNCEVLLLSVSVSAPPVLLTGSVDLTVNLTVHYQLFNHF